MHLLEFYFYFLSAFFILIVLAIYFALVKNNHKTGVALLLFAGAILRLYMANIDPFLYEWDEQFHALVAKNLAKHPLKPTLFDAPILSYDQNAWCCNHIWLHKQPLFLWQMALSIKILGTKVFAVRLPSVILGVLSIYLTYDITRLWLKNLNTAFIAALLVTCSFFQVELISGRMGIDHNDLVFGFYVTLSIWAFLKYLNSANNIKWSIITGISVGCAVLVKWLTGIVIFGGWGLYIILNRDLRSRLKPWLHISLATIVAIAVFMPWQLYTSITYPVESAFEYAYNRKHIFEAVEGHSGNIFFHFSKMLLLYGGLAVLIPVGFLQLLSRKKEQILSISLMAIVIVVYGFFSIAQTKMQAFTYLVNVLCWISIATIISIILEKNDNSKVIVLTLFFAAVVTLQPWDSYSSRQNNADRTLEIRNENILKSTALSDDYLILNTKSFDNIAMMFYHDNMVYPWYPSQAVIDSLIQKNQKIAAFQRTKGILPEYISKNNNIRILRDTLQ